LVLGISWHYFRDLAGGNAKICSTDKISGNMKMSTCKFTLKLLTVIEKSFKQILKKRRINYMRLSRGADAVKGVKLLFSSLPDYVCPYIFPMIVSDGRDVMLRQLNHFGIPAASWPDLPLEVLKRPEQHEAAIWLKDHILLLPLHQDLSNEQVEYMVFKLKEILEKKG